MNTSAKTYTNTNTSNTAAIYSNTRQQAASAAGALALTISLLVGIDFLATQNVGDQHVVAAASATALKS